jgi:excisionase family DNA binding protein
MTADTPVTEYLKLHSIKASAVKLGISESTLERLIRDGKVKTVRVSERRRLIPQTELIRIIGGAA